MRRISALRIFLICALTASSLAAADKPVDPIRTNSNGIALKGYDPVAYFSVGEPTKGTQEFQHRWNGATWLFSNAENLDLFKANPEEYAPQYGGYCAYAVSKGHTAGISPAAWTIHQGKLYLNHRFAKGKFKKDVPGNIGRADENWPKIPKKQ